MKRQHVLSCAMFCLLLAPLALAQTSEQTLEAEINGYDEPRSGPLPTPDPTARAEALSRQQQVGLLLIPESSNNRIMAFDPVTGDLIDPDFIPADPTHLSTPICAIPGFDPGTVLVADQLEDVVYEYDESGAYVGIFAPAGGVNNAILDNIRGIAMSDTDTLLVTVGGGANTDAIAEFDSSGNYLGNRVANGAGGIDSPFDVFLRASDYLSGGSSSAAVHQYAHAGSSMGTFAAVDSFPEQISLASNNNVLVGNFSGSQTGVVEFTSAGALVGVYDPASVGGNRGVYELPNGNILTTNGSGVHEIDRSGNLVETKITGVSARFIEFQPPAFQIPALQTWGMAAFVILLLAAGIFILRRRG